MAVAGAGKGGGHGVGIGEDGVAPGLTPEADDRAGGGVERAVGVTGEGEGCVEDGVEVVTDADRRAGGGGAKGIELGVGVPVGEGAVELLDAVEGGAAGVLGGG